MEEQRKFKRFPLVLDSKVMSINSGEWIDCRVVEISQDGIRLHLKEKIMFGQSVPLEIMLPGRKEPVKADLLILWSKQLYDETEFEFLCGAEMSRIVPDLKQLLLDFANHGPKENK